jgi:hypothetical protein
MLISLRSASGELEEYLFQRAMTDSEFAQFVEAANGNEVALLDNRHAIGQGFYQIEGVGGKKDRGALASLL